METAHMKMMMVVLPRRSGENFLAALIDAGFTATYSETRGGMLRQSQLTLFIAVNQRDVDKVIGIIREFCSVSVRLHQGFGIAQPAQLLGEGKSSEMGASGAVVFIWSLDSFEMP